MKSKYIFWGTFFITIGIVALLNNFGSLDFEWAAIWKIWPVVLVLWGAALLINNSVFKGFIVGITAIVLAVSIFAAFKSTLNIVADDFHITIDDGGNSGGNEITSYSVDFNEDVKRVKFNFDAGAGRFSLSDTTSNLFFAEVLNSRKNYDLTRIDNDTLSVINFSMKDTNFSIKKGKIKNKVEIKLNSLPVWDMDFDIGAASADFDLRKYKVENIDIKTGATSMKVKLGELSEKINFSLNAGVTDVDIYIPENSDCEIKSDAALSAKNFDGFSKVADDLYRTLNYGNSSNKIYLNLNAGVSSLSVTRYSENEW